MANQAPSSSKGNSSSNTQSNDALAESMDILEAARKLMHLSGNVDNKKHDDHDDVSGKRKGRITGEEGVHQNPSDAIASMIKKIFGNESEAVIARPKRKKKYRSLDNIYDVTTPINAENGTNATA